MANEPGTGKVVLVTGGNRGIGLAIAKACSARGDRVAVTTRSQPVEGFFSVGCDVTDAAAVDKAVADVEQRLGTIEVLVANAGANDDKLLLQMDEGSFSRVLDTNLVGSFRVIRRALPKMLRARKGRIVLISSVVALSGAPGQANYAAAKSGMVGFARSLAREVGGRNITVNVVAPGFIETDMTAVLSEARRTEVLAQVPLKRFGGAEEVAATVAWLTSDEAAYITGAVVPVDGGLGMGH
ncbi:MAG TPA: 3-oxoacyl-ACP reductase FabG [Acidimicrobiales bacterium]|nr:3-oxoacyl-ACP reductase FabG [Acidimicrobiales bacterium]